MLTPPQCRLAEGPRVPASDPDTERALVGWRQRVAALQQLTGEAAASAPDLAAQQVELLNARERIVALERAVEELKIAHTKATPRRSTVHVAAMTPLREKSVTPSEPLSPPLSPPESPRPSLTVSQPLGSQVPPAMREPPVFRHPLIEELSMPMTREPSFHTTDLSSAVTSDRYRALYDFAGRSEDELSLTAGMILHSVAEQGGAADGWLLVRASDGREGFAPSQYLEAMLPVATPELTLDTSCLERDALVTADFSTTDSGQLALVRGEHIAVTDCSDTDWWFGNNKGGSAGWFPAEYVQVIASPRSISATSHEEVSGLSPPDQEAPLSPHESSPVSPLGVTEDSLRREMAVDELIETEERYVQDLVLTMDVFYNGLTNATPPGLTEEEADTIFVNLSDLIEANYKLLRALKVRRKLSGERVPVVGDILVETLPYLQPYVRFCAGQMEGAQLLQSKDDPAFKNAYQACLADGRIQMGLDLSSYLLKPTQRVTRYPLLVAEILRHTPASHPDHENIAEAHIRAKDLCEQVNAAVRETDNSERLEWMQRHVTLEKQLNFNSLTNEVGPRKFLYAGPLIKVNSGKELYGFLFSDFLLLAVPTRMPSGVTDIFTRQRSSEVKMRSYRAPVLLPEMNCKPITSSETDMNIQHASSTGIRLYTLRARTVNDRAGWLQKIQEASSQYQKTKQALSQGSRKQSARNRPPVGRLKVTVLSAKDLAVPKGRPNSYCLLSMGTQEAKTSIQSATAAPKWNETAEFLLKNITEDVLCLTLYDSAKFTPDEFLGRTEIAISDLVKERNGIEPLLKNMVLHEVDSGQLSLKINLHLFRKSQTYVRSKPAFLEVEED